MTSRITVECGVLEIETMAFLECYANFREGGGQLIEENEFVEDETGIVRRIEPLHGSSIGANFQRQLLFNV